MVYRLIAELAMLLHFAFLAYLLFGGFLAWWRPRLFVPHAAVVTWGLLSVTIGMECPLSLAEHWARVQAGQAGLADAGFIETYLTGVVYPAEYLDLVRLIVAWVVGLSWLGLLVQRVTAARRAGSRPDGPTVTAGRLRPTGRARDAGAAPRWRSSAARPR